MGNVVLVPETKSPPYKQNKKIAKKVKFQFTRTKTKQMKTKVKLNISAASNVRELTRNQKSGRLAWPGLHQPTSLLAYSYHLYAIFEITKVFQIHWSLVARRIFTQAHRKQKHYAMLQKRRSLLLLCYYYSLESERAEFVIAPVGGSCGNSSNMCTTTRAIRN